MRDDFLWNNGTMSERGKHIRVKGGGVQAPGAAGARSAGVAMGRRNQRFIVGAAVCVIVAALAACAVEAVQLNAAVRGGFLVAEDGGHVGGVASVVAEAARTLIFTSILAAVVEELVFRGLLLRALLRWLSERKAILATSAIFALLHMLPVGMSAEAAGGAALAVLSLLLKGAQAFAFGAIMAAIVLRDGNLPIVMALHALFDVIYFAVPVLATGSFPDTYVAASPEQLLPAVLSTLVLLPPAIQGLWWRAGK